MDEVETGPDDLEVFTTTMRTFGAVLLVLAVAACTNPTAPPPTVPPTASPDPIGAVTGPIVTSIFQLQQTAVTDTGPFALPPSLEGYLTLHKLPALTVKSRTDEVVDKVCQLLDLPFADHVLEGAVDGILTKLRGKGGGEGVGLLVSAAELGCSALEPYLTQQVLETDPMPSPTPPPAPSHTPFPASLSQDVLVTRPGNLQFDVTVIDLQCTTQTTSFSAAPGYRYLAAHLKISSRSDGVSYDALAWRLVTDGTNAAEFVPTSAQPYSPYISAGVLEAGQYTDGWLLFYAPAPARSIQLTYRDPLDSLTPVLEVDRRVCTV